MPPIKHVHSYRRVGKSDTFHCMAKNCTHFTKKEFLIGKSSLCKCGTEFTLDYKNLQLKIPHCIMCLKPYKSDSKQARAKQQAIKDSQEINKIDSILQEIIPPELEKQKEEDDLINSIPRKRVGYEI